MLPPSPIAPPQLSTTELCPSHQQMVNISSGVLIRSDLNISRLASREDQYQFELAAPGGATVIQFQATWRRRRLRVATLPGRLRVRAVSRRRRARLGLSCSQLALRVSVRPGPLGTESDGGL